MEGPGEPRLNAYNQQLDALVAKDQQLYAGLKSRHTRDAFTQYLVEEVHANVGQTTGEGAPGFLAKQWAAFNSDTILDAAKSGVQARKQRQLRRFVGGEGTGSRTGVLGTEESMIERMIRQSGKVPE
jgi:hypothetical protein